MVWTSHMTSMLSLFFCGGVNECMCIIVILLLQSFRYFDLSCVVLLTLFSFCRHICRSAQPVCFRTLCEKAKSIDKVLDIYETHVARSILMCPKEYVTQISNRFFFRKTAAGFLYTIQPIVNGENRRVWQDTRQLLEPMLIWFIKDMWSTLTYLTRV